MIGGGSLAVVCTNCGAESSSESFCANCGARLPETGSASPTAGAGARSGDAPAPSWVPTSLAGGDTSVSADPTAEEAGPPWLEALDIGTEDRGRGALVAAAVLDLVAGALLFAWFVAGGLYGAGRGGGFAFNFGHQFNVAHTDNFFFGSLGLFTVLVLSVVAGILCLQGNARVGQVGRGLTVALATFGLALLVRFMQFELSVHSRVGWGGFGQLVFLFGLFALTFAGISAAAGPVSDALRTTTVEDGRLPWLAGAFLLTGLLCLTLFFPLFHGALDPNTGERLGGYFTHHYLAGSFILVLYLFVPALALLSSDTTFGWSLLGGWSLCLVVDALASVFTRDAFSSGALAWNLELRLAVSLALFVLAVAGALTTSAAAAGRPAEPGPASWQQDPS